MRGTLKILDKYGPCIGIRLWKSKTNFVQLWYCPKGYEIEPHSHDDQHIELMYLFGKTTFYRLPWWARDESKDSFTPKWYHIFRTFTVQPHLIHWFKVSNWPLIFINFATFIDGKKPTSAAIDFHKV